MLNFHSISKADLMLIFGIVLTSFTHQSLITLALKYETASKIMPYTYLPVLVSFMVDILVFEMTMSKAALIGTLLVSGSVLAPTLMKK